MLAGQVCLVGATSVVEGVVGEGVDWRETESTGKREDRGEEGAEKRACERLNFVGWDCHGPYKGHRNAPDNKCVMNLTPPKQ